MERISLRAARDHPRGGGDPDGAGAGQGPVAALRLRRRRARGGAHRRGPRAADRDQPGRQRDQVHRERRGDRGAEPAPRRRRRMLGIDVVDTGIGIPSDRLEAVFEPFTQAEGSTTRRFGGTGLGLTISRQFARGLGGDIVAHSEMGKGSVFSVTLDPGPLRGRAHARARGGQGRRDRHRPGGGRHLAVPASAGVGGGRRRGQPRAGPACARGGWA